MAVCSMISQVGAISQPNSEIGGWEDLWPEVSEGICKGLGAVARSHI